MSRLTSTERTAPERPRVTLRVLVLAGLAVSLILAVVLSSVASEHPDGLEHVASSLGFEHTAEDSAVADSPLADYGTAGVESPWLSTAISGAVGLLITGLLAFGLMRLLARKRPVDQR